MGAIGAGGDKGRSSPQTGEAAGAWWEVGVEEPAARAQARASR